ncbi:GlcG/HbpS family heme-binding protein [Shimia sediminis]|uniref:GlcG/HbpS family heme-binding protein n=1 Tax=Shimia sediminis TaxID=2497945 RepID=UPI000F8DF4DC|nr:heme-binding protein [Shimia sediminis]
MKSIEVRNIAFPVARDLVDGALAHAQSKVWSVAVAVVDSHGFLVAFGRGDGVSPVIGEFATDKAHTAAMLRKSTAEFGERMATSPTLSLGVGTRSRLLTWGGGLPIFENGVLIGGLGVSGAQDFEDIACAEFALAKSGLLTH